MEQSNKTEEVNKDDGITIGMLLAIIRSQYLYFKSKWITLLICLILGAVVGLLYSIYKKPQYLAQTTFTIDETTSSSPLSGLASQFGITVGSDKNGVFDKTNIISLFQSRLMVQKTLLTPMPFERDTELLVNRYIEFNHYRDAWKNKPELSNITFEANKPLTRLQDSVLNIFYNDIVKSQLGVNKLDMKLTILSLTYTCKDELFSKEFSEAIVKNVMQFYTITRTKKTANNVAVLQHQVDSVKERLTRSLVNVASSTDATPNANPLKSVLGVSTQNRSVDAEIDRAAVIQLSSSLEAARVQLNQQTPLIDFIDTPILPLEISRLSKTKGIVLGSFIAVVIGLVVLTFRRKTY